MALEYQIVKISVFNVFVSLVFKLQYTKNHYIISIISISNF